MSTPKQTTPQDKQNIYTTITNKIIAELEVGNLTWAQPWQVDHTSIDHTSRTIGHPLRIEYKPDQGIDISRRNELIKHVFG